MKFETSKEQNYLGKQIVKLRRQNGFSQEDFSEKLDVSRQTISKWEGGKALPSTDKLKKLCEVFDVSADELYGNKKYIGTKEKHPKLKMAMRYAIVILAFLFIIYISYSLYKFCVLTHISNKVKQYETLDNYYCHIIEYGDTDIKEDTKVWYKDGVYKIETNNNQWTTIIDLNKSKRYEYDTNNNCSEYTLNKQSIKCYENGGYLYNSFPEILKKKTAQRITDSLSFNIMNNDNKNETALLKFKDVFIQYNKDSFLPISLTYLENAKKDRTNYAKSIKYYEIELNIVEEVDIKVQ